MNNEHRRYLENAVNEKKCTDTVLELDRFVWYIRGGTLGKKEESGYGPLADEAECSSVSKVDHAASKISFLGKVKWQLLLKDDAKKLVSKLKDQQQDIFMAVTTITMCVAAIWPVKIFIYCKTLVGNRPSALKQIRTF